MIETCKPEEERTRMPRKPAQTPKKPAPKRRVTRTRRTPYDLVQDLKAKREALLESMGARIGKLDQRIAELESKHAARIQLAEIMESKTPEEIEREEAELRQRLALMKRARKLSTK